MPEREYTFLRRDELLQYLNQRRDRSVFWNERQLFPSEARAMAESLDANQLVGVYQQYVSVPPAMA